MDLNSPPYIPPPVTPPPAPAPTPFVQQTVPIGFVLLYFMSDGTVRWKL